MNILYVCTGNSCRSQMAEGWTRALAGDDHAVRSAGMQAHGLNPRAVHVMQQAGVDIAAQRSSVLDEADLAWADLVVTVCGDADERCPVLPPGTQKRHWPLADPATANGTADEVDRVFAETRNAVRSRVEALLDELSAHAP